MKYQLRARYYIRYCDDFVILSDNRIWLEGLVPRIQEFLCTRLRLELHPQKVSIKTIASGVDFLGWVQFPDHRLLRMVTKKRMLREIKDHPSPKSLASYFGLLGHGNTQIIRQEVITTALAKSRFYF